MSAALLLTGVSAGRTMGAEPHIHGGWTPIRNLSDPYVIGLGEFAVAEYDKQTKERLVFHNLVSGMIQELVGATNYQFVIAAENRSGCLRRLDNYTAAVSVLVTLPPYKSLDSFKPTDV